MTYFKIQQVVFYNLTIRYKMFLIIVQLVTKKFLAMLMVLTEQNTF